MTSIFSLEKWFEIIQSGTSGDQVSDILYSWKAEVKELRAMVAELEEDLRKSDDGYKKFEQRIIELEADRFVSTGIHKTVTGGPFDGMEIYQCVKMDYLNKYNAQKDEGEE